MNTQQGLFIALHSLKARKTRTFLASLGIVIGIASVIIMVAIGKGSQQKVLNIIKDMGENLITVNAGEAKRRGGKLRLIGNVTTLTLRDALALADEIDTVSKSVPFEYTTMNVKYGNATMQLNVGGTVPEFLTVRKYELDTGEFFSERAVKIADRVAVLGKTAVGTLFGTEDPIGQTFRIKTIPFTVIGIFKSKGVDSDGLDQDDIVIIPLTTMMRRVLNQTHINTLYLQATSQRDLDQAVRDTRDLLRYRHRLSDDMEDDFTIHNQSELEALKLETEETFTVLIVGVAAISLIVGGIGILAVMLITVKERTREIGARRAAGATRNDLIQQFLLESLAIGFLGGAIGSALGSGITWGLSLWSPWTLILDPTSIIVSASVCLVIGIVFGLFPAIKASRLDPMDALRVE